MAEKKKVIVKTVNRTGKSLVKKALIVKVKKQSNIKAENIKKLNEKIKAQKEELVKKQASLEVISETKKTEDIKTDKKYNLTVGLKELVDWFNAKYRFNDLLYFQTPKSIAYYFAKVIPIGSYEIRQAKLDELNSFLRN